MTIRTALPLDHPRIVSVADTWWGRPVAGALPRLFLDHFHKTSFIGEVDKELIGFVVGFVSPSNLDEAYIHFVGVHPRHRRSGLARALYERFFDLAGAQGRTRVIAITPSINTTSIGFHRAIGFDVSEPVDDYDGFGVAQIVFRRKLER